LLAGILSGCGGNNQEPFAMGGVLIIRNKMGKKVDNTEPKAVRNSSLKSSSMFQFKNAVSQY
jgi:hypothetical protein